MADNIAITEGSGKTVATDDVGGAQYQRVKLDIGGDGVSTPWLGTVTTNQETGTITSLPNLPGGTINLVGSGTITKLEGGTLGLVTRVGNVGTLEVGTISSLPNLPQGSINVTAGTIATMGTMGTLGLVNTVTTVTTVSNLTNGSVRMTVGTLTGGTLQNLVGGTLGEITNLVGGTVTRLAQGSINVTAGTITAGSIIVTAGTQTTGTVNTGTINTGTINTGTVTLQPYPAAQVLSAGTTTNGTIGTLVVAAGAGTGIYVNSFSVNALSGTPEIVLSYALQAAGNQVVNRGAYPVGGGIAMSFPHPSYYGTANAALTWNTLANSGTFSLAVTYTTKGTP